MNPTNLQLWLQAQAYIAEIEAAKIENKVREMRGESPSYGDDWFYMIANNLNNLAGSVSHE
jgi:hypothetical protein